MDTFHAIQVMIFKIQIFIRIFDLIVLDLSGAEDVDNFIDNAGRHLPKNIDIHVERHPYIDDNNEYGGTLHRTYFNILEREHC